MEALKDAENSVIIKYYHISKEILVLGCFFPSKYEYYFYFSFI